MIDISKVVIGTWPLSGDLGEVKKKEVYNTLEYCREIGIKEYDTAPNYGNGTMEKMIGDVFEGEKNITINTKCGNNIDNKKDFGIQALQSSLYDSLERLCTKSVGTLFLHNPRQELKSLIPILEFFQKEKLSGNIINSGISLAKDYYYNPNELKYFDALQNDLNLLYLKPIINDDSRTNIFYARSPLATGLLAGKIDQDTIFPTNDYRSTWLKGARLKSILLRVNQLKDLSDISIASLARKFLLQLDYPQKVIFGVKNRKHIDDIIEDLNSDPIDNSLVEQIIQLYNKDYGLPENHKKLCY